MILNLSFFIIFVCMFVNYNISTACFFTTISTNYTPPDILNHFSIWLAHISLFVVCKKAFLAKYFLNIFGFDNSFHISLQDTDMGIIIIPESLPKVKYKFSPPQRFYSYSLSVQNLPLTKYHKRLCCYSYNNVEERYNEKTNRIVLCIVFTFSSCSCIFFKL